MQPGGHICSQRKRSTRAMTQTNKCHQCGATNYKPVIKRDEGGTMNPSGAYQCVGCELIFTDIDAWRNAPAAKAGEPAQQHDKP